MSINEKEDSDSMEVIDSDRRQATRKALLSAARDLVFERGHDRVSVQDITARAKVATGTYYNYFESKQDIFLAVAEQMHEEMADQIEPTRNNTSDPAMRIALTLKYYFYQSADNEDWREFTRNVGLGHLSLQQDPNQLREDIQRGVKAGRFRVDDIHFTQSLISGMVHHVNVSIQKKQAGRNTIEFAIRSILQMLGLPDLVSKALTQTPLPPVSAPKRLKKTAPTAEVTSLEVFAARETG